MKECKGCYKNLPIGDFYKKKSGYYESRCFACAKKYNKEYRKANKEKLNLRSKKYKQNNKESLKKYHKQYYLDNKKHIKQSSNSYYYDNIDKVREYREDNKKQLAEKNRVYREENKGKWNAKNQKYFNRKRKATPKWLTKEQLIEIENIYIEVSNLEGDYHVDHIVPLKGEEVCGLHVPWNLQILTAKDNLRKSNKLEAYYVASI